MKNPAAFWAAGFKVGYIFAMLEQMPELLSMPIALAQEQYPRLCNQPIGADLPPC